VAGQSSKRGARKRRNPGAKPKAVPSQRREQRAVQRTESETQRHAAQRTLGTVGERPPSPFGGVPASEIAIFAGIVASVVWFFVYGGSKVNAVLVVGLIVLALGVIEVTAREHFSGYRSHTTLLAALPAFIVAIGLVALTGEKAGDAPLLAVAVPIFLLLFWPLRRRFQIARQARIVRRSAP
jgi:UDP-N-acetylmuramyl pentapeptide phosphotransferase/UDP-N-acetylglucosamine-1-phosphate transferase